MHNERKNMNWNKLKPWNWFKKEQNQESSHLPVRRADYPQHALARLHDDVDRLFDSFFEGWGMPSLARMSRLGERGLLPSGFLHPSVDISENKKGYTIRVEIPGVEKDDVKLTIEDDTLFITGEKRQEKEDNDGGYHCVERSYGTFQRMISLPADADQDKLEAKFRNGVLTITLPRKPGVQSNAREITIS
jgi:HSP20 family protein